MCEILLVDDSPVDRKLFATLLEKENFEVRACDDGQSALDIMEESLPDIVLTDMQMPGMDGLELVEEIRRRFSSTPVILITGHGSEDLATKALRAGAAGYVPKSNSTDLLSTTIRHVLELNKTAKLEPRLRNHAKLVHYELELPNDETLVQGILQLVRHRILDCVEVNPVTLLQVEVALEHAIMNAIYHGNLDFAQHAGIDFDNKSRIREAKILNAKQPYCDRRVSIAVRISPVEARFVVKDEGAGFDVKEVSSLGLTQSLRGDFGQGLFLMWAFMDKVVFDKTGTGVTLLKRLEPAIISDAKEPSAKSAIPKDPLLVLQQKDSGKTFQVLKERVTLGRDPSCDIEVNEPSISFHHCLLYLHEGWWFVRDLKSKNGIKVNGTKHDAQLLPPQAVLSVGKVDFSAEYHPHKLGGVGITPPVNPF